MIRDIGSLMCFLEVVHLIALGYRQKNRWLLIIWYSQPHIGKEIIKDIGDSEIVLEAVHLISLGYPGHQ